MKTTTNELPHDLSNAITAAQSTLLRAEKLAEVMRATGTEISSALAEERQLNAELGRAEIDGGAIKTLHDRLNVIVSERAAAGRRRSAASEALLHADAELTEARQTLDRARQLYATGVIAEFTARWQAACDVLAGLRAEAESLSRALGVPVPTPPPYVAGTNRITDRPELRPVAAGGLIEPPPLPPALAVVAGVLDRIDSARGLSQSVRQGAQLTQSYFALARERGGMKAEMAGIFEVTREFELFGTTFTIGMLVDRTVLCGEGMLQRFWTGRRVEPVSVLRAVAAA